MGITVLEGDFQTSAKITSTNGGIEFWGDSTTNNRRVERQFVQVDKLEFLDENFSGGSFAPLGFYRTRSDRPAGLLLGANAKKAKQTVYFKCTLIDGRYFIGATSAKEFQRIRSDVARPPLTAHEKLLTNVGAVAVIIIFIIFVMALIKG